MPGAFDPYYRWLSIPPEDQPPTHYRLLGVKPFESDLDVIESAADRQMAHVRSFQTGKHADWSQKLLNELAAAKHCLLSSTLKAEYDRGLRARAEAAAPSAAKPAMVATKVLPTAKPLPAAAPAAQAAPADAGFTADIGFDPLAQRGPVRRSGQTISAHVARPGWRRRSPGRRRGRGLDHTGRPIGGAARAKSAARRFGSKWRRRQVADGGSSRRARRYGS